MFITFNKDSKTGFEAGNGIIQTGKGIIFLVTDLQLKNFLYKLFLDFTNKCKAGFANRKWNYLNRNWNYPNRKWNYINRIWIYFSYFLTSDKKTSCTKCF